MRKNARCAIGFPPGWQVTCGVRTVPEVGGRSAGAARALRDGRRGEQRAEAQQIVDRVGEGEDPMHGRPPAVADFAEEADCTLPQPKISLHAFLRFR